MTPLASLPATVITLADAGPWRPFIDPINAHSFWYLLLVPISFFIAVAYKAVRVKTLTGYWTAVAVMTVQIILGMIALAAAFYIIVQLFPKLLG